MQQLPKPSVPVRSEPQSIPQVCIMLLVFPDLLLGAFWSWASAWEWVWLICIRSELGPILSTTLLHTHKHLRRKKGVVVLLTIALLTLEMGSLGVTFVNPKCLIGSVLSK